MNSAAQKSKTGSMLVRLLAGAIFGVAAAIAFLTGAKHLFDFHDPVEMFAMGVGLSYALIGLMVGVGVVSPSAGSRYLNVENREELVEDRAKLGNSAIACVLIGVFLILLAAATEGPAGNLLMLLLLLGCAVGVIAFSMAARKHNDELTRQLGLEAAALTLWFSVLLFGGWAALNLLGYATVWVSPLGFVAGIALVQLAAIFIACGRRGLLLRR